MPTRAHSADAEQRRDGVSDELVDSQRKRHPPPVEAQIAALARAQHGVVELRQLLELGLSRSAVAYRLRTGRLHRVMPGVLAVGHDLLTSKGRFMAAVLSCGEGSLLSHRSAACHRALLGGSFALVDVSCPRQRRARAGLRVHRTRTLAPRDVTVHDGIPITSVARTLLDLADVAPCRLVERAIHQAEILRVFDLRAVDDVLARANGRRGAAVLRAVLAQEPAFTRSELEEALLALVATRGAAAPADEHAGRGPRGRRLLARAPARRRARQPPLPPHHPQLRIRPPTRRHPPQSRCSHRPHHPQAPEHSAASGRERSPGAAVDSHTTRSS